MAGRTVVEKVAACHRVSGADCRAGEDVVLRPRHCLTHDNTSAVLKKFVAMGGRHVYDSTQPVFALDHDIQNRSEKNLAKYHAIEEFAKQQGIDFHPAGTGIGHQVMVERLYALPGSLVVASDSHANTYGAIAAIGTPVVRTDAACIWLSGRFWWRVPETVRVLLEGTLPEGVSGKDLILALCARFASGEARNRAIEFSGPGFASLSMDARLTIANMTTEWGALTGWFPADEVTTEFLRLRKRLLPLGEGARLPEEALDRLAVDPPRPDNDAVYVGTIRLDLGTVRPVVSGPHKVSRGTDAADAAARRIRIQKAYLVSCVNGRDEDLAAAAKVLEHRTVAPGVEFYVGAASKEIEKRARKIGVWKTLVRAGAIELPPGCGPCIGLGRGLLEPGEAAISATNRNFRGRMGSRDSHAYLGSPAVVAASAAAGFITTPEALAATTDACESVPVGGPLLRAEFEPGDTVPPSSGGTREGFPEAIAGRFVFLSQDDLDTDGIYSKDYTYRDDVSTEEMARVVFANLDPALAARIKQGDILVAGDNFGTGSSREQAATALIAAGIELVIAAGFSQTYLRNAFNNGLLCVSCKELVAALRRDSASSAGTAWIPGDRLEVRPSAGEIVYREYLFPFTPLSSVAQDLYLSGGMATWIRKELEGES